jgi:glycosyltransferase involved in cell wall biosynthesis
MIKVSFVIPTLNAQKVLEICLKSIIKQKFSRSSYEIIVIDGGSVDNTIKIAKTYNSIILKNPLKTAEAGKAIGIKQAKGEYICLLDSDNILPKSDWLSKMLYPFDQEPKIIGTEPIKFTYRPNAGLMEKYSALIGANDPYSFISGVYDKQNYINNKWTGLKIEQIDKNQYILVNLNPLLPIPTIGANGTIFKSNFLKNNLKSDYLFDIDIISQVLYQTKKPLYFAKVKIGIIHTFCESSIKKFIRKQNRRLTDYYHYQPLREFDWNTNNSINIIKFSLYTLCLLPAIIDSIRGYFHQPDLTWFFHPIACYITLIVYSSTYLKFKLGLLKAVNRDNWKQ